MANRNLTGTRPAREIDVQIFRQTMLLPLALDRPEDASKLERWVAHRLLKTGWPRVGVSPWREEFPDHSRKGALRRNVEPSRAFRAAGLCEVVGDDANQALNRTDHPEIGARAAPEDADAYSRRWVYAEAAYFHPFVQRFLFGGRETRGGAATDGRSPRLFRRSDIAFLRAEIGYDIDMSVNGVECDAFAIDLVVERCDLYLAEMPGLLCLLLEVAATKSSPVALMRAMKTGEAQSGDPAERELGGRRYILTDATKPFTLVEAQALHDCLRRLYPPFFEEAPRDDALRAKYNIAMFPGRVALLDDKRAAIAETSFDGAGARAALEDLVDNGALPVGPWWETLLAPVALSRSALMSAQDDAPRWRQVIDDRMPTVIFLAVEDSEAIERSDLIRLCFADQPGAGPPYAPAFLEDFEKRHCYDRFRHRGTRYMASSYSFVCVASAGATFPPAGFSFALDVTQEHVRRHYTYMFLITHLQRAALLMFSRWMSDAMHGAVDLHDSRFRHRLIEIRTKLAEFAQRSWFTNVSNQEQARELFDLMQRRAETKEIYAEVVRESGMASEELAAIAEGRQQASALTLNILVALTAALATPIGFAQGFASLDPEMKLTDSQFFIGLSAACLFAAVAIVIVATLQLEGRLGSSYLRSTLLFGPPGRALQRMRWIVRVVVIALIVAAGYFGFRGWTFSNAPAANCVVTKGATTACPP